MVSLSVIVVMGARVKEDGTPSGAMTRRVAAALDEEMRNPGNWFLVTGGIGTSGYSESQTMLRLLQERGVPASKIILEDVSTDTLASIVNCTRIIRERKFGRIKISSDIYHIPRCRWLFRLAGIHTEAIPVQSGRSANGIAKWCYYYLREGAAILWDTLLINLPHLHPSSPTAETSRRKQKR
jgi:vancomycin permeability regulator SanA